MTSYLTEDCIYYILKYLQNYHTTLFNCILVDRFWCRAAIPLLYTDPFVKTNKNDFSIILTLISCFNKEEIMQLKNQIKFNINNEYKPLFEYPKYLKSYDCESVNPTIINWINHLPNPKDEPENICSSFHQLILNHCVNIERINININLLIKSNPKFNIPTSNLTKLNSLTLNNLKYLNQGNGKEFLSNIAVHCLNLKELSISSGSRFRIIAPATMEKLCTIIQKQNNLEEFKVSLSTLNNDNILFLSLENQKHSLVSIEFSFINFSNTSFKDFINLCNLNYLKFYRCFDSTDQLDRYEILKFASFKLKRLELRSNIWNKNFEPTIIKTLGSSLQRLTLGRKILIPTIENISIYCLKLIELEVITGFYSNLLICPNFKNLKFSKLNIYDAGSCDNSKIFRSLANNLSVNVKRIAFRCKCQQNFRSFLENCHNYLEKITLYHYFEGLEFLKTILNYIEKSNNGLRKLNIVGAGSVLNDEELKLLDEIHMKGVKIITKL